MRRLISCVSSARFGVALLVTWFPPITAGAVATPSDRYPAAVVATPPKLSLDFGAPPWDTVKPIVGFETLTTHSIARYPTTARIIFDASNVYVAIHCAATPAFCALSRRSGGAAGCRRTPSAISVRCKKSTATR